MRPCDLSNILGQLDADDLNRLDRKTREVVRGVEETGQQGTITLALMPDPAAREQYKQQWMDRRRSSLNNIGGRAHEIAKALRAAE